MSISSVVAKCLNAPYYFTDEGRSHTFTHQYKCTSLYLKGEGRDSRVVHMEYKRSQQWKGIGVRVVVEAIYTV